MDTNEQKRAIEHLYDMERLCAELRLGEKSEYVAHLMAAAREVCRLIGHYDYD